MVILWLTYVPKVSSVARMVWSTSAPYTNIIYAVFTGWKMSCLRPSGSGLELEVLKYLRMQNGCEY